MSAIPAHLLGITQTGAVEISADQVPEDSRIVKVRDAVAELQTTEQSIAEKEAELVLLKEQREELKHRTLPGLFDNAGMDSFSLKGMDWEAVCRPYYKASISAEWPPERREEAFRVLEDHGGAALVKTEIIVTLDREFREEARELQMKIQQLTNHPVTSKLSVPWATLTSWVRERLESDPAPEGQAVDGAEVEHKPLPLDKIGATVGMIVEIKPKRKRRGVKK